MRRQLPCKLTSYAADTGNKHRFALHIFGYHIDIDADNLSFQKIFNIDVADLLYADLAVCDLIKPGKLLDLAACMRAYLDRSLFRLMRYRRYRNDYSSTPYFSAAFTILSRPPTIGTPNIRLSCFERSSSIMQTTRFDEWSLFWKFAYNLRACISGSNKHRFLA